MVQLPPTLFVFVVMVGCGFRAEEGPWTGSVKNLIGGPCVDDPYGPGNVLTFTILESTSSDGFELTTDEYTAECALEKQVFACDLAEAQVDAMVANTSLRRTFVYSGRLSTRDNMSGTVAFESTCTGTGCTTTTACNLTWEFSAEESS